MSKFESFKIEPVEHKEVKPGISRRDFLKLGLGVVASLAVSRGEAFAGKAKKVADVPGCELENINFLNRLREGGVEAVEKELRDALHFGNDFVHSYIADRSKKITHNVYLGPNMDGTYFYRLGVMGTDGYGMDREKLVEIRKKLISLGFPKMNPVELRALNFTNFFARKESLPGKHSVVKHFPGGDEMLEITEKEAIHYDDPKQTQKWLEDFQKIIDSDTPPDGIMLSHATYNPDGFPGMDSKQTDLPEGLDFSQVPASFNPLIVKYLREKMGFKGIIISDWYNMGSAIDFVDGVYSSKNKGISQEKSDDSLYRDARIFYYAIKAGVNFVPGISAYMVSKNSFWKKLNVEKTTQFFNELDNVLLDTYKRIKQGSHGEYVPELVLSDLDFLDKITLLSDPTALSNDSRNEDIFEFFRHNTYVKPNDIWNRTGVLVLIQRQKTIEKITGKKFVIPPNIDLLKRSKVESEDDYLDRKTNKEEVWFTSLMADKVFRSFYDTIPWDSPEMGKLFQETSDSVLGKHKKRKT